jgi:hypothetical protein
VVSDRERDGHRQGAENQSHQRHHDGAENGGEAVKPNRQGSKRTKREKSNKESRNSGNEFLLSCFPN